MKKIMVLFLVFLFISSYAVVAETDYYDYINDLENENTTLQILDLNVKNMEIDVFKAELESKSMLSTIEGFSDLPYSIGNDTISGMRYVAIVVPKQVNYGLFVLSNNKDITEVRFKSTARLLALGVISNSNSYVLNLDKNTYYKSEYDNAVNKFDLGLISETELLQAEVKALEASTNLDKSERDLEDSYRSFNSFIGYDLNNRDSITLENQTNHNLKSPDYYIELALENRFEFEDLNEQIKVQDAIIDFYNYGDYMIYSSNASAERQARIQKEKLELELKVTIDSIKEEILNAVGEINVLNAQIQQLESTLEIQRNSYNNLLLQVEQGYMTESAVQELEFAIRSIENNLDVMYYSYNTKRYDLFNASVTGPAYGGGM